MIMTNDAHRDIGVHQMARSIHLRVQSVRRDSGRLVSGQRAARLSYAPCATREGKFRQSVLDNYLKFLANSPPRHESPPEWILQLNRLIAAAGVPDRRAWLDQIERVGDPAIAVYAQVARLRLTQP
jgi:hypothetical protein